MGYIATIIRVNNSFQKSYMVSTDNESKERFIERVENCYIKPYKEHYYDVEIFEVKERVFSTIN
jgi:hypothetical protein